MAYRSMLFVPGARADRFEKARLSGADAVTIDLEDAVAPHLKAEARAATLAYLSAPREGGAATGLRLNALNSLDGLRDVVALAESGARPAYVMIPKAAGPEEIHQLRAVLGADAKLWPLMETPEALPRLYETARAVGETGGIMFGGADYSASLGSDMGWDALCAARAAIVAAAAAAGCEAMDVPFLDVADEAGLRAETARVKAMGFTGRSAIHPSQIAAINAVFTASAADISKAEKIARAYDEAEGGVALLEGRLIEKPVLRAAKRILDQKG